MGRRSKRKERSIAANAAKASTCSSNYKRAPFLGVAKDSPIKMSKSGKRSRQKKVVLFDLDSVPKPLRTVPPQNQPHKKKECVAPSPSNLLALESKYQAILELLSFKWTFGNGRVPNTKVAEIANKWGVGTGPRLRFLCRQALKGESLQKKKGQGAKKTVTNRPDIYEFMCEQAKHWEFEFTLELMAGTVKDQFGVGSTTSVTEIMDANDWTKKKQSIQPFLTLGHIENRLTWCEARQNVDFFQDDVVYVHIDEKWFYAFRNGKVLYCPPGIEAPSYFALSKTQIPKLMYFGAIAPPNPKHKFDGKLGLWRVSETKTAKRNSKYHKAGDVFEVPTTMDGDLFVQMCKELLIPSIKAKCKWAKSIEVQMDSAGGHKVHTSVDELNQYCKRYKKQPIIFVTQPTRSPDLNTLDLGTWNSIQSHVPSVKYQKYSTTPIAERINAEVVRAWKEYDGDTKIHNIYITLSQVYKQVIGVKGGNVYKLRNKK